MKLLSKWPLTHYLYSQCSLTLTLPQPFFTFTCPCACSVYCNCIRHLALQAADEPAQGQLPTLATFINRLFAQAYQSPYPLSLCGCLWTLCSSHRNRSPVCEGGFGPPACSERDWFAHGKGLLCLNNNDSQSLSLFNLGFCRPFAICSTLKQVVSPPQSFPECNPHPTPNPTA